MPVRPSPPGDALHPLPTTALPLFKASVFAVSQGRPELNRNACKDCRMLGRTSIIPESTREAMESNLTEDVPFWEGSSVSRRMTNPLFFFHRTCHVSLQY